MTAGDEPQNRRIVVGVDGSPSSRAALRWAVRQAALTGSAVDAVTAWRDPAAYLGYGWLVADSSYAELAAKTLADTVENTKRGSNVSVRQLVVPGHPAAVLTEAARGADLLVVGRRGHGGFPGLLLGSVSQHCAQRSPCPAVIIPGSGDNWPAQGTDAGGDLATRPFGGHEHRVVVGVDGSDSSKAALSWAFRQARLTGAALEPVIAWEFPANYGYPLPVPVDTDLEEFATEVVTRAVAGVSSPDEQVTISPKVAEGDAARVLLDASAGADLLAVGSRGHGGFAGTLLGSVSQHCAHHATVPVLIIRDPGTSRY